MIRGLLLIFETAKTWEWIANAGRRWDSVLMGHLLPLLLMTSVVEGYSLMHWGRVQSVTQRVKFFGLPETIAFEGGQMVLTLIVIFFCAKLIKSMGDTFHGRHTFGETFIAIGYGVSPLLLFRFLNIVPAIPPWATWVGGVIVSIAILYYGLPCIMKPDPPHAFGLYLTSSLLLVLISGLECFITSWYLLGKFERLNNLFPSG